MVLLSLAKSRLSRGLRTPDWTSSTTCSTVPPVVRLATAHTASFWALKSPWKSSTEKAFPDSSIPQSRLRCQGRRATLCTHFGLVHFPSAGWTHGRAAKTSSKLFLHADVLSNSCCSSDPSSFTEHCSGGSWAQHLITKQHRLKLSTAPMCTGLCPSPYLIKQLHQRWQQPAGDELLDLLAGPSCNVAECPRCLLLYSWLCMTKEKGQDSQDTSIDSCLGLFISPCNHIPNGTQSWSLDRLEQMEMRNLISRNTHQKDQQEPSLSA